MAVFRLGHVRNVSTGLVQKWPPGVMTGPCHCAERQADTQLLRASPAASVSLRTVQVVCKGRRVPPLHQAVGDACRGAAAAHTQGAKLLANRKLMQYRAACS